MPESKSTVDLDMNDISVRIQQRLSLMKKQRLSFEKGWMEIAKWQQPWKGRFFVTDHNDARVNTRLVDNTAVTSSRSLGSGMMTGISSPARPWFKFAHPDPEVNEIQSVKSWLFTVERIMQRAMAQSNIYNVFHQTYTTMGLFSNASFFIEEDEDDIFRATSLAVGTFYFGLGANNRVDTIYREFNMTVRQLVSKFGYNNVSESTRAIYNNRNFDAEIQVLHAIEPNDTRDPLKIDNKNMPYRSVYIEMGAITHGSQGDQLSSTTSRKVLRQSGFHEFPCPSPRWEVEGDDTYGSNAPGSIALGDARSLQVDQKTKAKGYAKMVDPPMNVPASMQKRGYSLVPGSVNYINEDANGNARATPAHDLNLPLQYMLEDIREKQDRIKRAYFEDLFLLISSNQRSNVTATEIVEGNEEKLFQLGPVLGRVHSEMLDTALERIFGIMQRGGHFPDPPEELVDSDLRVEYISVLAQAQRLVGVGNIERVMGFAGNLASVFPDVVDKIDVDETLDEYSDIVQAPPGIIRSTREAQQIRDNRAQAAQAQEAAQMAATGAQAAQVLSETDTRSENGLTDILTQIGLN